MLATPDALEQVVFGDEGLALALGPGQVFIDMSTVGPATVGEVVSENSEQYTNHARCSAGTDANQALTTARGSLSVELDRYGWLANQNSRQHAQDEFGSSKRYELTDKISSPRVFDVARLGDSAFVSVDAPHESDRTDHRTTLTLEVLAGDRTLRLFYIASPTTEELAVSAAVTVARALLGALR